MVDRLRALLEEPLSPQARQAVVVLSCAILLGLSALFILAAREPASQPPVAEPRPDKSAAGTAVAGAPSPPTAAARQPWSRQDPQDQEGSPAARRAARALRSHRALQHVPFRSEALTIELVGARGHRALLRVTSGTIRAARLGWRGFLRRHRDTGRAYIPIFRTAGAGND